VTAIPTTSPEGSSTIGGPGRLPLEKLVRTFPFEQINEAIEAQHRGECVKVVLTLD